MPVALGKDMSSPLSTGAEHRSFHSSLRTRFTLVLVGSLSMSIACQSTATDSEETSADVTSDPDPLDQGWTDAQTIHYERTSDGSGLFPYKWLVALEQSASSEMFLSDANVGKYGFIPSPNNPDRLPVGLAKQTQGN